MRVVISYFIKRLVLAAITDTAAKFVKNYLDRYLRKELLEDYRYTGTGGPEKWKGKTKKGLEIGNILAAAIKEELGDATQKQKILEDLSFKFTDPGERKEFFGEKAEDIIAKLIGKAHLEDIGAKDARKIVRRGGGVWDAEDLENFEDLREDFLNIIAKYLTSFFRNTFLDIMKKKKDPLSPRIREDIPVAEAETAEFIEDFEEFTDKGSEYEKGESKAIETLGFSVKDLREFLKEGDSLGTWGKPTEKDRKLWLTILDSNVLKKKGEEGYKTHDEIAKEFDLPKKQNVQYQVGVLKNIIKTLMAQRGKKVKSSEAILPYSIVERRS